MNPPPEVSEESNGDAPRQTAKPAALDAPRSTDSLRFRPAKVFMALPAYNELGNPGEREDTVFCGASFC